MNVDVVALLPCFWQPLWLLQAAMAHRLTTYLLSVAFTPPSLSSLALACFPNLWLPRLSAATILGPQTSCRAPWLVSDHPLLCCVPWVEGEGPNRTELLLLYGLAFWEKLGTQSSSASPVRSLKASELRGTRRGEETVGTFYGKAQRQIWEEDLYLQSVGSSCRRLSQGVTWLTGLVHTGGGKCWQQLSWREGGGGRRP